MSQNPQKSWYRTDINFYIPCLYEMDPDLLFSGFGAIGPKLKKVSPDPFCCLKALCEHIFVPYHLPHVSLPCFTVVSRMGTIPLFSIRWRQKHRKRNIFAEETIQRGLGKAKCPKYKNAVYLEVQKKLEQHGKYLC